MSEPDNGFCVVSNIWIRQMRFASAGDEMQGHRHNFDHATLCAVGRFRVTIEDGGEHEFDAPCVVYVEKGKEHTVKALTNGAIAYCIHGIHDPDDWDSIINPDMMPQFGGSIRVPLVEEK